MSDYPKVSIVIVNLNGKQHLSECFGSIKALDYPGDKVEVVMVDNGSSDGSAELVQEKYGWVKLLCNRRNEGFAKPSNDGARAARGEYVAFLNNDMRVQKDWLRELINSLGETGARCAGSVITNWDGTRLDFAGGSIDLQGFGFQDDYDLPMKDIKPKLSEDKDLLFACGGAMIVDRELFLSCGGFDEDYFAYYEDVDLGWRLRVLGCRIVLSAKSRVRHKHNSTSRSMTKQRIQYLFERNKLYTCYKNYSDEKLYKVFFPSLLLDMREAYAESGIDGDNYDIRNPGAFDAEPVRINHMAAIKLSAINEFTENLPAFAKKRSYIQKNRMTGDDEIDKLFSEPFKVFIKDTSAFVSSKYEFVNALGLEKLFGAEQKCQALFVSDGADNALYEGVAAELAASGRFAVTLAGTDVSSTDGVRILDFPDADPSPLIKAARETYIVMISSSALNKQRMLLRMLEPKYIVADLSRGPDAVSKGKDGDEGGKDDRSEKELDWLLREADFFICPDNKRTDVLERLEALGRVTKSRINGDTARFICSPENDGCTNSIVRFCEDPARLPMRGGGYDDYGGDAAVYGCGCDAGEEETLEDRLARIEARESDLRNLMLRSLHNGKKTQDDVRNLAEWSYLMESRFTKLKSKLAGIKLLRKFVR